jgi:hypothetical protein
MIAVGLGLSATLVSPPAPAQLWGWAKCGTDASDIDAIQAVAGKLLDEDAVGASRSWSSPSGHSGHVYLLSGGAKAGSNEGKVRITKIVEGREKKLFTFKYRKTPDKGWATCG